MDLLDIVEQLTAALRPLRFGPPVKYVYNPLEYAIEPYRRYIRRYAARPCEVLLLGMNPGPWGMAQTGIPFGEVALARDWLAVAAPVGRPPHEHPQRPVLGFDCQRSEVSGARLWGWARKTYVTAAAFSKQFCVGNYCPLCFLEASGRNRTPDKLPSRERRPLLAACDEALRQTVDYLKPRMVIGVGAFAESRARAALAEMDVRIGRILHPSPANPRANRDWETQVEKKLASLGVRCPAALGANSQLNR